MRFFGGLFILALSCRLAAAADVHMPLGFTTTPQQGWVALCAASPLECEDTPAQPGARPSWSHLEFVNRWVNHWVKPMSDLDHWGPDAKGAYIVREESGKVTIVDKWSYPDDGYGDCEDYVLLKRRMLMQAGWLRGKLLITVVHDKKDLAHAVLTVVTSRGDLILDNETDDVLLWSRTGYHFVRRQSQTDPNDWIEIIQPPDVTNSFGERRQSDPK
jgi:predicted transglutaminase-like cysteine proteinase